MKKRDKIWLQRPNEGDKPYAAFWCYVSLGLGNRTFQKVSDSVGKNRKLIERWASAYEWTKRVKAYDASIVEEARQQAIDEEAEMLVRHRKLGQLLQKNAVDGLKDRDMNKASFHSLTLMIERGIQIERDSRAVEKEKEKIESRANASPMMQLVETLKGESDGIS